MVRDGSTFRMTYGERFTLRTHPGVRFTPERLEVFGRLENGVVPVEFAEDMQVEHTVDSICRRLLSAVMPLVDNASGNGTYQQHTLASTFAFNMFGQAVAYFRSAEALINASFPAEALAPLRGLVLVAARFEQMLASGSEGIGIAVRYAPDAIANLEADPDLTAQALQGVQSAAETARVTVPDQLALPETTSIYRSCRGDHQQPWKSNYSGAPPCRMGTYVSQAKRMCIAVRRLTNYRLDVAALCWANDRPDPRRHDRRKPYRRSFGTSGGAS